MELKPNTYIESVAIRGAETMAYDADAPEGQHWTPVREPDREFKRFEDDGEGPVWVLVEPSGYSALMRAVVRARSFERAWELALDLLPAVERSELVEAYGFDTMAELVAAERAAREGEGEWPELVEGYYHQSNGSVVSLDCGWQLHAFDPYGAHRKLRLIIRAD